MMTRWISSISMILLIFSVFLGLSFAEKIEPPWCPPPAGFNFTVAGVENVPDLHGEIVNPDLVVFFAGNQFMVVPDLLEAFRLSFPSYRRIFVETLPPGILAQQIEKGSLVIGNLKVTVTPDVYTAGEKRIAESQAKGWFDATAAYGKNRLAIMVSKGNPKNIRSLEDLGRPDVRVSMPNPNWEGIAVNIIHAYNKAGGKKLEETIMVEKAKSGMTFLTHIHHRQTPIRIMKGESDAGPVWYTEAYFQMKVGNPIDLIEIPEKDNVVGIYIAGRMKDASHKEAGSDFFRFLRSEKAQSIYKQYGFLSAN
jgi:molybdate transport system substrate-binding protein